MLLLEQFQEEISQKRLWVKINFHLCLSGLDWMIIIITHILQIFLINHHQSNLSFLSVLTKLWSLLHGHSMEHKMIQMYRNVALLFFTGLFSMQSQFFQLCKKLAKLWSIRNKAISHCQRWNKNNYGGGIQLQMGNILLLIHRWSL